MGGIEKGSNLRLDSGDLAYRFVFISPLTGWRVKQRGFTRHPCLAVYLIVCEVWARYVEYSALMRVTIYERVLQAS